MKNQRSYGGALLFGNPNQTITPSDAPPNEFVQVARTTEASATAISWRVDWSLLAVGLSPTGLATFGQAHIVGRVHWGLGGAQHMAEFDWGQGGSLTLTAETVSVDAFVPTQGGALRHCATAATIAPAEADRGGVPLTRSTTFASIAGGATVFVPVPPFARMVSLGLPPATAAMNIRLTQEGAISQVGGGYVYVPATSNVVPRPGEWLPLTSAATLVRIENLGVGAAANVAVYFALAL